MSHRHTSREGEDRILALTKGNNADGQQAYHTDSLSARHTIQMDTLKRQLARESRNAGRQCMDGGEAGFICCPIPPDGCTPRKI